MPKNPTLKWGIGISLLYVIFSGEIWDLLMLNLNIPDWLFLLVTFSFLILPSLIAYSYDKEHNHPKYYAYIKKIKEEKENETNKKIDYMKKYGIYNGNKEKFSVRIIDFNNYNKLNLKDKLLWAYKEDENLCFIGYDHNNDIGKIKISISNIQCFSRLGDLNSYTKITGGGGGGSSIGKAIVGGVIAGEAGAIIASRNKTEEIKSEHVIEDNRNTVLEIKDNNAMYYLKFESNDYNTFLKLIPNKEISFVKNRSNVEDSVYEKIKKLSNLKDEGILTEQEFTNKKSQLLESII